jgi:hypothetical protein
MLTRPCSETVAGLILVAIVTAAMYFALAYLPR